MSPTATDPGAATTANQRRNARATVGRRRRWTGARDALWNVLEPLIGPDTVVGVLGAGNADDVPLQRLARSVKRLDLLDVDLEAVRGARRRIILRRRRVRAIELDITAGAADRVAHAARTGQPGIAHAQIAAEALGCGPYDLLIADLLYTQLLYPALVDARLPAETIEQELRTSGEALTAGVVTRLHACAPTVVHVHDLLGFWEARPQPFTLQAVLQLAATDPVSALALADTGNTPTDSDPRPALKSLRAQTELALWQWPFEPGTDYLITAFTAQTGSIGEHVNRGGTGGMDRPATPTPNVSGDKH